MLHSDSDHRVILSHAQSSPKSSAQQVAKRQSARCFLFRSQSLSYVSKMVCADPGPRPLTTKISFLLSTPKTLHEKLTPTSVLVDGITSALLSDVVEPVEPVYPNALLSLFPIDLHFCTRTILPLVEFISNFREAERFYCFPHKEIIFSPPC